MWVTALENKGEQPERTITISFPAAFLKALVHLTLRGFRFILRRGLETGIQHREWTTVSLEIFVASV